MLGRRTAGSGIILIMAIGLWLRLHYVLHAVYPPLQWDQLEYTKLAIQLLEKGIYAYRDTVPNTLVTPGWPLLLALFFKIFGYTPLEPTLMIIRITQCFMALGAIYFIYRIGCRLFNSLTGLTAASFAAVYPSYVWSASLILTEVPFLTVFTALLYMQVRMLQENRRRDHLLAGVLAALCVLIRPNVLPLIALPYVLLWAQDKKLEWRGALAAAASFSIVMLPWWIRNWVTFHEVILVAKGEAGNPFLGGTDPYFRGTINWSKINEKEQFAEGIRRIKMGLHDDPWLWISWLTAGKFVYFFKTMWAGPYYETVPEWYYHLLVKLHKYVVCLGWATAYAFTPWSRSVRFLGLTLVVFLAVHMAFIPVDRYAYGMLPLLMLLTAHFAVNGAALAWAGCKQAGRFVQARR